MNETTKEFEALCKPVIEYLRKNHNPHSRMIITDDSAVLLSAELGVTYLEKENVAVNDASVRHWGSSENPMTYEEWIEYTKSHQAVRYPD